MTTYFETHIERLYEKAYEMIYDFLKVKRESYRSIR